MSQSQEAAFPFSDLTLSRRLERAEAYSNAMFVEARARVFPESGARWIEVAGAYAMFDGVRSPCTQTFGLGLFQPITHAEMEIIEAFYRERSAPVFHEVSPLADLTLPTLLNERNYRPFEFTSVMFRPIQRGMSRVAPYNEKIRVRLAQDHERTLWAETAAKGWKESEFTELTGTELVDFMFEVAEISARRSDALSFLAEMDGSPVAAGGLSLCEGVALLAGASTIPEARKQGAQRALLDRRLNYAAEQGCNIAMMCAQPGSASQRNAERQGFRIAYTRIKWQLAGPAT